MIYGLAGFYSFFVLPFFPCLSFYLLLMFFFSASPFLLRLVYALNSFMLAFVGCTMLVVPFNSKWFKCVHSLSFHCFYLSVWLSSNLYSFVCIVLLVGATSIFSWINRAHTIYKIVVNVKNKEKSTTVHIVYPLFCLTFYIFIFTQITWVS